MLQVGLNLANHVVLAALAMTVHVLVNQKYVGHIIVLAACAFSVIGGMMAFPYLAVYNGAPRWTYSDMNGFGPFLRPYLWFKLYWASWALLLGVIALLFWMRGREPGLRSRLAMASARLRGPAPQVAALAIALIIGSLIEPASRNCRHSAVPIISSRIRRLTAKAGLSARFSLIRGARL